MRVRSVVAALFATSLVACAGAHNGSTPPSGHEATTHSQQGARVSASRFAEITNLTPGGGSVETRERTLHIIDGSNVYIVPSDAIIQRSATETTVTVGHAVQHLSTKARIVGHGVHRRWNTPAQLMTVAIHADALRTAVKTGGGFSLYRRAVACFRFATAFSSDLRDRGASQP